jgi:hypothetical protein
VEDQRSQLVQALKGLLDEDAAKKEDEDDGAQTPPEQEQKIPQQ